MEASTSVFSGSPSTQKVENNPESKPSCCASSLDAVINGISEAAGYAFAGFLIGAIVGAPLMLTAGVTAAYGAAIATCNTAINSLAEAYDWKISTVVLIRTAAYALIATAAIVATISLGILGTTGAVVVGGLAALTVFDALQRASVLLKAGL